MYTLPRKLTLCLSLSLFLQAFYRRGVALQGLERHEEAMIVFAEGLSADPKQAPMLHGLVETMIKSPYRGKWSWLLRHGTGFMHACIVGHWFSTEV